MKTSAVVKLDLARYFECCHFQQLKSQTLYHKNIFLIPLVDKVMWLTADLPHHTFKVTLLQHRPLRLWKYFEALLVDSALAQLHKAVSWPIYVFVYLFVFLICLFVCLLGCLFVYKTTNRTLSSSVFTPICWCIHCSTLLTIWLHCLFIIR